MKGRPVETEAIWYTVSMQTEPTFKENGGRGSLSLGAGFDNVVVVPSTKAVYVKNGGDCTLLGHIVGDPHAVISDLRDHWRALHDQALDELLSEHGITRSEYEERVSRQDEVDPEADQAIQGLLSLVGKASRTAEARSLGEPLTFDYVDRNGALHTVPGTFFAMVATHPAALREPAAAALAAQLGIEANGVAR